MDWVALHVIVLRAERAFVEKVKRPQLKQPGPVDDLGSFDYKMHKVKAS